MVIDCDLDFFPLPIFPRILSLTPNYLLTWRIVCDSASLSRYRRTRVSLKWLIAVSLGEDGKVRASSYLRKGNKISRRLNDLPKVTQ